MAMQICEPPSNRDTRGAGPVPERLAGGDGGAGAAATAVPGPAAHRGHRGGAGAPPGRCRLGLAAVIPAPAIAVAAPAAPAAVAFLAAGRGAGIAAAAAGSAARGVRRVPLPWLLDGAGGLAAAVRAGAAGASRPHLLQSVPRRAGGCCGRAAAPRGRRAGSGDRAGAGPGALGCSASLSFSSEVTSDVTWEDSLLVGLEGALLGCAYYLLFCRSCGLAVGFILHSSGSELAHLRDLFCFFKDSIMCYFLKNQMIIEASKVNFPAVTLKKHMQNMKEKLVELTSRVELLTRKLDKIIM
uniref:Mis18 domain-containing protein n=1 Tax=Junco hyemalis TaxID=40217 RepID=A0A8C5IVK7_JUNHY